MSSYVYSWGRNRAGELGYELDGKTVAEPRLVSAIHGNPIAIASGTLSAKTSNFNDSHRLPSTQ